jgi:hypothetical protein
MRRYSYSNATGVELEEDDDGNAAQGLSKQTQRETPKQDAPKPAPAALVTPADPTTPKQTGKLPRNTDYVIPVGKNKGKTLADVPVNELKKDVFWWAANGKIAQAKEYVQKAEEFLADLKPGDESF